MRALLFAAGFHAAKIAKLQPTCFYPGPRQF